MDEKRIALFWSHVERRGPEDCWPWTGARNERGYGVGWTGKRTRLAHRIAWFLTCGSWPADCLCHRCDNPPCCNPAHCFEGSRKDNLVDMRAKGRGTRPPVHQGPTHHFTPLTIADVIAIRAASDYGCVSRLAKHHGISTTAVSNIRNRKSWCHVD